MLFIGLTAEPYHTHAIWYGMMNALGIFRMNRLVPEDIEIYTEQPHYFWPGKVRMAAVLAGVFAVCRRDLTRGKNRDRSRIHPGDDCFHAAVRLPAETDPARGMQADAQAVVDAFGKNEHVMRVVWMLAVAMTGLVITKVLDPGMVQEVGGILTPT